ncbi:hypothetical protein [Nocardioides sp. CFH 31398]|uniref:hypothetical protein n=1 Tax=Nocardioides sp. CFH 31398 TaxID=2919579 RepID=UPI001F054D7E|nr:hypothetical protein [Nocardioides sp. CFH 31398]MCH1867802.1 hypothetical protein [Nocardioides sp. CFH 31398]
MTPAEIVAFLGGTARADQLRGRVGRRALREAVSSGALDDLGHGRYGLPSISETHRKQVLLSGTIGCLSAAVEHGWPVLNPPDRPWIAVPPKRRVDARRRRGVNLMWADVEGTVTSPLRTVLDCLVRLPAVESLTVADSALRLGVVDPDELRHAADQVRGPGSPAARRLARAASGLSMSPLESALRALLLDLPGLDLRPQVELTVDGMTVHPDLFDERLGIVVEAEGWLYHGNPEQFALDLERYTCMAVVPLTVLRFGHHHVTARPDWVRACVDSARRTGEMRRRCRTCA